MFRKTTLLMFAEDQFAVDFDVKDPSGPFDKLGLDPNIICDCCCQTDSLGGVVSNDAVGDADSHCAFRG